MEVEMPNEKIDQLIDVLEKQEIEVSRLRVMSGVCIKTLYNEWLILGYNGYVRSIICWIVCRLPVQKRAVGGHMWYWSGQLL